MRDGSGNPTTIVVEPDEILIVTYELRFYLDTSDYSGSITIGGVVYNYTQRMMNITSVPSLYVALNDNSNHAAAVITVYSGSAGSVTGVPSGSNTGGGASFAAYTPGNRYVDVSYTLGVSAGNYGGGIKALSVRAYWHAFQLDFTTNPIMKVSGQQMTIRFRLSWSRYAP